MKTYKNMYMYIYVCIYIYVSFTAREPATNKDRPLTK